MVPPMFSIRPTQPTKSDQPYKNNYRKHKNALRADYNKRCGYCGIKDLFFWSGKAFHIDHFAPQSLFRDRLEEINCYSNLVYSCPICNIAKSNKWVSNDIDVPIVGHKGFLDPSKESYENYFYRDEVGKIRANNDQAVAAYMHREMKFYLSRHELFWLDEYIDNATIKIKDIAIKATGEDKTRLTDHILKLVEARQRLAPFLEDL